MNKFLLLFGFSFFALLGSAQTNYCIPNRFGDTPYFDSSEVVVERNILYGNAFNKYKAVDEDLKLDIYFPDTTIDDLERRPLILHTHGGTFLEGDKSGGAYVCREWARRGFVVASINYRMGWACANTVAAVFCLCTDASGVRTAMYEAIQDNRAALRYLTAHASEYGINPDYCFLAGESAGSITSLMSAYINQAEVDSFTNGSLHQLLGALDSSGNNLPGGYTLRGVINNCGAVNDTSIITPDDMLPTISFQDENDCLVPYRKSYVLNCTGSCYNFFTATGSSLIHQKISALGGCSKLYEVKGSGSHCSFPTNPLISKSSCFLRGILCNDCQSGYSINPNDTVPCKQDIATTVQDRNGSNGISALRVYPNPSNGQTVLLSFELHQGQQMELIFMDVLGRETWRREGFFESGRHTLQVESGLLSSGVNYCILRSTSGTYSTILLNR